MGRVAREVLDGLPSRASAGSTLCARCSTGVAAVGPRLGGDGDLDLRGDGDLDLCGDRSLLLSRRVSAALAYTPQALSWRRPATLVFPLLMVGCEAMECANLVARMKLKEASEGVASPLHCSLLPPRQRLRLYPEIAHLAARPHLRFQPMRDAAEKRCPRPGSLRRPLGQNPTGANYPMTHARKRAPRSVASRRLQT